MDRTPLPRRARKQFDKFSTQNPRIRIAVVDNPTEQEVNAVSPMFQQGKGPDVYRAQGSAALDQFVEHGWAAGFSSPPTSWSQPTNIGRRHVRILRPVHDRLDGAGRGGLH